MSPLVFPREKKLNEAGALRVRVCTLFARVHVFANVHAYQCARVSVHVHLHASKSACDYMRSYLCACRVCEPSPARWVRRASRPSVGLSGAGPYPQKPLLTQ